MTAGDDRTAEAGPTAGVGPRIRPAVLALGANLGDRASTLRAAVADLDAEPGIEVTRVSSLVETVALRTDGWDDSAPRYLNAVALVRTSLDADALLAAAHRVEADHGRRRGEAGAARWADRTIDIDIVDLDGETLETPGLTLPHPQAAARRFVLEPWLEVDADAVLPHAGRVAELLDRLPDDGAELHRLAEGGEETRA